MHSICTDYVALWLIHKVGQLKAESNVAVPRKAAGDVRAYDRVETEPGLDKFVNDAEGKIYMPLTVTLQCPIWPSSILPCVILPCVTLPCFILPCVILPSPVPPCPVPPCLVLPCPAPMLVLPCPVLPSSCPEPGLPCPALPCPVLPSSALLCTICGMMDTSMLNICRPSDTSAWLVRL